MTVTRAGTACGAETTKGCKLNTPNKRQLIKAERQTHKSSMGSPIEIFTTEINPTHLVNAVALRLK